MSNRGDELLPCPFCGGTAVRVVAAHPQHARYVMCLGCNNSTAMTDTTEQAAELWNRRAYLNEKPHEPNPDSVHFSVEHADGTVTDYGLKPAASTPHAAAEPEKPSEPGIAELVHITWAAVRQSLVCVPQEQVPMAQIELMDAAVIDNTCAAHASPSAQPIAPPREPTREMTMAAVSANGYRQSWEDIAAAHWRAMWDRWMYDAERTAALKSAGKE